MFESAHAHSIRRAPRAPRLVSTAETCAPPRENPAGSATNPRRPRRPASRAESRAPSPAFAFQPGCPAPRPRTLPLSPDTAASSAPCPGPAARFAHQEIPYAAFLPNAPSLLQRNRHISTGISGKLSEFAESIRSNDTPAGSAACDASSKCCNSRTAPTRRSSGTAPTTNIRAGLSTPAPASHSPDIPEVPHAAQRKSGSSDASAENPRADLQSPRSPANAPQRVNPASEAHIFLPAHGETFPSKASPNRAAPARPPFSLRSEEHTSELQSHHDLV